MQAGTTWGGEYSRWSYDESLHYVMLAKQMLDPATSAAIPLLDDELNYAQEIILNLLRRAIKRLLGDGCPADHDGFLIAESTVDNQNNFAITGGDGTLPGQGFCFVDGWMCINDANPVLEYTAQSGPAVLTTPSGSDRTDEVYIDCYLEEVSSATDATIKDASLSGGATLEPSRRLKLVWDVKVSEGSTTPAPYTDGNNLAHWTLKIAELAREDGVDEITTAMITDFRNRSQMPKRGEYIHVQSSGATTWTIAHNLDTLYPIVRLYDGSGEEIDAEITITDADNIAVDFDGSSVSGKAVVLAAMAY